MASSLNKHMIIGNVGKDPEVRFTASGTAVASFSVATSESFKEKGGEWKEKTHWHNIIAWGKLAELVQEHVTKGLRVYIEGPVETRKWQDKAGNDRYTTETKADKILFLGKGGGTRGADDTPADDHNGEEPPFEDIPY